MSTAAATPGTTPATEKNAKPQQGGYDVARPMGKCHVTGETIAPGEKFMAALRETPQGFERVDVSLSAWPQFDRKDVVAFWQATMPAQEQKKKLFVDDEVLCDLFERLRDTTEPPKLRVRSRVSPTVPVTVGRPPDRAIATPASVAFRFSRCAVRVGLA